MTSLTNADLRDMALYTLNQRKVHRRNELLKRAPHIGSHTTLRVWRCTDEYAFRDPIELDRLARKRYERAEDVSEEEWSRAVTEVADTAIVCDWRFDETGCNAISCNPYYPGRGVCEGFFDDTDTVGDDDDDSDGGGKRGNREKAFAFVTAHGQRVDVCQPICYDEDRKRDTYVGMTTLYANKDGTCFVTDPELLAFYLDPQRRAVTGGGVTEKSAFRVGKEYIGATGAPAVVATIDRDYCRQYGLDYTTDREHDGNGETLYSGRCTTDEREGDLFSMSTWIGDTLTRTYNFARDRFEDLVKRTSGRETSAAAPRKESPTMSYLADDETWRSHIDRTKRPLPFPLKLAHLGLNPGGGVSDGLMWTDEYSFLDDGRNDPYGGRIVERPRGIARPIDAAAAGVGAETGHRRRDGAVAPLPSSSSSPFDGGGGDEEDRRSSDNHETTVNEFIKELAGSLEGFKESIAGTSYAAMVDQAFAGYAMDTIGDLPKRARTAQRSSSLLRRALGSSLKRMAGQRLSNRAVSLVATQTAIKSRIETHVVEVLTSKLKLPFRLLARGANALSFIQLVGAAVDLFTALVYDPYEKYGHYMSDRVLRAMAQAELVATQRLTGRQRVTVEPFEWMANTRFSDPVKDATYDMLLGVMYTRARRVNSEGSLIYWYGDDDGDGGTRISADPARRNEKKKRVDKNRVHAVVKESTTTTTTAAATFPPLLCILLAIVFCASAVIGVSVVRVPTRRPRAVSKDVRNNGRYS